MKKIGIIASVVALGAIGAYALVPALFPNTPAFPRVPVENGTIGEMIGRLIGTNDLANYSSDGTVENTNFLSGVSATGYLQSITCPATNIWKGIDANGKALCGPRVPMLTDYGRVSDQKCPATIYKTDGSTIMSSSGYILKGGDVVQTPVGCDLTIAFSDLSTLHLDEDTTVSLDMGVFPDNTTIATAILENGQIWGRILTETGVYNVGTRDVVAAVRGTSIALSKTGVTLGMTYGTTSVSPTPRWNISGVLGVGPNGTKMTIVDSTIPTGSAKIHCEIGSLKTIANLEMKPGNIYDMPSGTWTCPTTLTTKTTDQLYTENRWIASNTLKDLDYMSGVLQNPGLPSPKIGKITNEYTLSFPTTPLEKNKICLPGEKFFAQTLGMTQKFDPCKTIAFADYIHGGGIIQPLLWNDNNIYSTDILGIPWDMGFFVSAGTSITYNITSGLGTKLSNKLMTIEATGAIAPPTNRILVDFGGGYRIKKVLGSSYQCTTPPGSPPWFCHPTTPTAMIDMVGGVIQFRTPPSITTFMLGNNSTSIGITPPLQLPILLQFKRIFINN